MYIVKHTLQSRDAKTKEPVYYLASPEPQSLPAALAKEAISRGFAEKVVSAKKSNAGSKTPDIAKEQKPVKTEKLSDPVPSKDSSEEDRVEKDSTETAESTEAQLTQSEVSDSADANVEPAESKEPVA